MDWCDQNGYPELAAQFEDPGVCSGTEEVEQNGTTVHRKLKLYWRSELFSNLMTLVDHQILTSERIGRRGARKSSNIIHRAEAQVEEVQPRIPEGRSFQVYDEKWLTSLEPVVRERLKIQKITVMSDNGRPATAPRNT